MFTNAPEEVAGAAVGQPMATTQILLCGAPRTRSSSIERPTEASWTGLYYFQNCVFISCPWLTLQALAQGPETRPYASRLAVSKLLGTATLPVTVEAPLEAKSQPCRIQESAIGATQACTCPSQEAAAAGRDCCREAVRGHLPGGLLHPISHRGMLVAVGGVRQGTQGTL